LQQMSMLQSDMQQIGMGIQQMSMQRPGMRQMGMQQ